MHQEIQRRGNRADHSLRYRQQFVSAFAAKAAALGSSDGTVALYLLPLTALLVSLLSLALSGGRPRIAA